MIDDKRKIKNRNKLMKKFLLAIAMLCGIVNANAQPTEAVYNDELYVTVNGNTTGPYNATVNVKLNENGTIRFSLDNFILIDGADELPVGNIVVDNLPMTPISETALSFSFDGILTVQEGTDPAYGFWVGPGLGELPTQLSGALTTEHLYVVIDIDAAEMLGDVIHVEFGKLNSVTAINTIKANNSKFVGAFDLAGRKVSDNFKGIRIVNGKKVVR